MTKQLRNIFTIVLCLRVVFFTLGVSAEASENKQSTQQRTVMPTIKVWLPEYLVAMGNKLNCYFTEEQEEDEHIHQNIQYVNNSDDVLTIAQLVKKLNKELA